jgi:hypothetical protein
MTDQHHGYGSVFRIGPCLSASVVVCWAYLAWDYWGNMIPTFYFAPVAATKGDELFHSFVAGGEF